MSSTTKMKTQQEKNRKKILHNFIENPEASISSIAKCLKLARRTVSDVFNRYKESLSIKRKLVSGRKQRIKDKKLAVKIRTSLKANPGLSDRDWGKRYNTSASIVLQTRQKAGYKSNKAIKCPNRNDKQSKIAKSRARLLYNMVLPKFARCILMDEETCVKMDFKQIPGQKFYTETARCNVPSKFKIILHDKYAKKIMIWQAIYSCGKRSQPYLTTSTMKSENYMNECLQKRLLPFIRSHDGPVMFWLDLASCHYSRATLAWYEAKGVLVIPKK